jgi:hypothetical protein
MVECPSHYPKIEGSNPATGTRVKEKVNFLGFM